MSWCCKGDVFQGSRVGCMSSSLAVSVFALNVRDPVDCKSCPVVVTAPGAASGTIWPPWKSSAGATSEQACKRKSGDEDYCRTDSAKQHRFLVLTASCWRPLKSDFLEEEKQCSAQCEISRSSEDVWCGQTRAENTGYIHNKKKNTQTNIRHYHKTHDRLEGLHFLSGWPGSSSRRSWRRKLQRMVSTSLLKMLPCNLLLDKWRKRERRSRKELT
ncbi:uncharacterized protein [Takifugu rubripes]|uniref:uncharacterized protein n=1 Tax=Takifugu rubripes TaxID=31033 RepID=UPI001146087E|nr:uncharacterized protein LOC115249565 [Takifugu rubripes]